MTIALSAVFAGTLASGAWMLHAGASGGGRSVVNGVRLFDDVAAHVRSDYVDSVSQRRLYGMAVQGVLTELDDPYDAYLTPSRLARLTARTSGSYAGIGLQVDLRDGSLVVVNPLPGSPGEAAGIMTGDRIVQIDGKSVSGWAPDEVQHLLRGAPGSPVTVTIEHPGSVTPVQIHMTRAEIHQSAVRHAALVAPGVGYIAIGMFSDSTARELSHATDSLVHAGATSLVLDLRSNPGGLLRQGVGVADLFLDRGAVVARTEGRTAQDDRTFTDSTGQRWPALRLAALVDDKTASAAEIVAGALQDHDRAVIVGQATFGKGSVQRVFPVTGGGAVRLTTARWYTPSGRSITRIIAPDAADATDTAPTPRFRTSGGRVVLGGGGITPDLSTGDTLAPAANVAFMRALGRQVPIFRDALASFALDAKAAHRIASPSFPVTPAMLNDVYHRMQARGVDVPRNIYDDASSLVSRLLSYEVERYVFGADAEFRRKAADDRTLQETIRLLADSRTEADVLARAARMQAAASPAPPPG